MAKFDAHLQKKKKLSISTYNFLNIINDTAKNITIVVL